MRKRSLVVVVDHFERRSEYLCCSDTFLLVVLYLLHMSFVTVRDGEDFSPYRQEHIQFQQRKSPFSLVYFSYYSFYCALSQITAHSIVDEEMCNAEKALAAEL